MKNTNDLKKDDLEKILNRLNLLEERISVLESGSNQSLRTHNYREEEPTDKEEEEFSDLNISASAPFESNLGEYGLAWLGNIVLFFAIAFLWKYFNDAGRPSVALAIGCISVTIVFLISQYFRKSFTYLSFMFNLFGFIILYYIILRLHYYTVNPIVSNQFLATVLSLAVVGVFLYFAVNKQSQGLAGFALTMALFTGFACEFTQPFFLISIITTGIALYFFWKYNWWKSLIYILCFTYLVFFIWLLKPHAWFIKSTPDLTYNFAFIYISISIALYSIVVFRKPNNIFPENTILSIMLLSGIAYSIMLLTLVLMHFQNTYIPLFTSISIYCIAFSILLKIYSPWKYAPALYALFGFVAISVTIFGIYHFPNAFLLLFCQSFLVLVLAIWYRSHIITLMNTFLMLFLMVLYFKLSGNIKMVNFSIPIVAFLSARIINWQKERLNIKTDYIRNIYLLILFFSLLYATFKALPGQYITVSWLIIACIYLGLSILLKSIKYRWMALANLLVSALYLFLVDLAKIDLVFRILAFLVFAIISIGISIYYANKLNKKNKDIPEQKVK